MPADNQPVDIALTKSTYTILERARTEKSFHSIPKDCKILDQYPPYQGETTLWYSLEGIIVGFGKSRPSEADKVTFDQGDLYSARFCVDNDGISETLAQSVVCGGGRGGHYDLNDFKMEAAWYRNLPLPVYVLVKDIIPQIREYRTLLARRRAGENVEAAMGWPHVLSIDPDDLEARMNGMKRARETDDKRAAQIGAQALDTVERHQREIHDAHEARKQMQNAAGGNESRGNAQYARGNNAHVGPKEPVTSPSPTILDGMSTLWAGIVNYVKRFYKGN